MKVWLEFVAAAAEVFQFFLLRHLSFRVALRGVLKGGDSLVNDATPGLTVSCKGRPLMVVYVTVVKWLQMVLVALLWCSSVTMASGEFAVHCNVGQTLIFHSGDVPCPLELWLQQHSLDTGDLCQLQDFYIGDEVASVNFKDDAETALMETLKES